ncbi:MarR family winged helix-turn-helix transcriptional regulator [Actinoallomurus purpureus]|uniref:MarR family winged helix-turn-helix transcriptional regulator n=1 Tax=Actinoallomurus purpureus TaxID=478114 RepID=UPI002093115C|nr:MarR family winged helix-turn-helix transcriptional regulator [Actinoallomurus purpureus]MCO6007205.1 MarR family winged helix-turn-helix transcriptional regulator [Actinoallomurus purpureus]
MLSNRPGLVLAYSGQIANGRIKKAMAAHGLKPGHGGVLMQLADKGAMGQQALVEELGLDPSVLVTILNDLENDGLAERRRDPADRRRHIVEIRDRGTELVGEIHRAVAAVEAELFADLNADELDTLQGLLERIRPGTDDGTCTEDH